jgi:hypothetical protein
MSRSTIKIRTGIIAVGDGLWEAKLAQSQVYADARFSVAILIFAWVDRNEEI